MNINILIKDNKIFCIKISKNPLLF